MSSDAPSRKEFAKTTEEINIEPFYVLKSASMNKNDNSEVYDFYDPFRSLVTNELQQAADSKKSLDEALETIQMEGQKLLDAARMKPSSDPGGA